MDGGLGNTHVLCRNCADIFGSGGSGIVLSDGSIVVVVIKGLQQQRRLLGSKGSDGPPFTV